MSLSKSIRVENEDGTVTEWPQNFERFEAALDWMHENAPQFVREEIDEYLRVRRISAERSLELAMRANKSSRASLELASEGFDRGLRVGLFWSLTIFQLAEILKYLFG